MLTAMMTLNLLWLLSALQAIRMPIRTIMAVYGEAVRVRTNIRMAIPIAAIHQPEKPSLYITNMKPA